MTAKHYDFEKNGKYYKRTKKNCYEVLKCSCGKWVKVSKREYNKHSKSAYHSKYTKKIDDKIFLKEDNNKPMLISEEDNKPMLISETITTIIQPKPIIDESNNISSLETRYISSQFQTKDWRKTQMWYRGGKSNECETFQVKNIEKILGKYCTKTTERLNIINYSLTMNQYPFRQIDGFEWTEDFDRKIQIKEDTIYFNLKFVCDEGGAQTRSLREVYSFIYCQIQHLLKYKPKNTYFINILDGDTSHKYMKFFLHLITKEEYNSVSSFLFCGDTNQFQIWWKSYYTSGV